MKEKSVVSMMAGLLLAGVLGGCHEEEHHEEAPPSFEVTTVIQKDTEITRDYVCQIRAIRHIDLRPLEQGYIQQIFVDEGQSVTRGTPLFQIVPVLFQAELARSSAEARFAEVEYQNTRMLREGNVVSPNELALAQAHLDKAAADRQLAQAHLRFAGISAPFDGIVGRLMVRAGSLVEEGELLTVLSDNSEMWVYFNVSEADYLAYRAAHGVNDPAPVRLRLANNEIFDQPGTVQTIEADFNNETGTIAFRAGFPNPAGILRHGETGTIVMSNVVPHALLIPQKATFEVLDKTFVYVVGQDGVLHAREIQIGEAVPHLYVVHEGLHEGDRILIEGLRRVHDGEHIEPNVREAEEVFAELDVHAE